MFSCKFLSPFAFRHSTLKLHALTKRVSKQGSRNLISTEDIGSINLLKEDMLQDDPGEPKKKETH